jgi:hypothetical protein
VSIRAKESQLLAEFEARRQELRREEAREKALLALRAWAEAELATTTRYVRPEGWGTEVRDDAAPDETTPMVRLVDRVLAANRLDSPELRGLIVHVFGHGQAPASYRPVVRCTRLAPRLTQEIGADGQPTGREIAVEVATLIDRPLSAPAEIRALGWTLERLLDGAYSHLVRVVTATIERDGG